MPLLQELQLQYIELFCFINYNLLESAIEMTENMMKQARRKMLFIPEAEV